MSEKDKIKTEKSGANFCTECANRCTSKGVTTAIVFLVIVLAFMCLFSLRPWSRESHTTVEAATAIVTSFKKIYSTEAKLALDDQYRADVSVDSLFNHLNEEILNYESTRNEILRRDIDELNQHIVFWLSIICAICTILPIAMSIQTNIGMSKDRETMEKKYEAMEKKYEELVERQNQYEYLSEIHRQTQMIVALNGMADYTNKQRTIQDDKHLWISLLSELQDFYVHVASPKEKPSDNSASPEDINLRKVVLLQMRDILYRLEVFFKNPVHLATIDHLKDKVNRWTDLHSKEATELELLQCDQLIEKLIKTLTEIIQNGINDPKIQHLNPEMHLE